MRSPLWGAQQRDASQLRIHPEQLLTRCSGRCARAPWSAGRFPVELEVELIAIWMTRPLQELLMNAVPCLAPERLMRGKLPSLFTLSKTGRRIATGQARPLDVRFCRGRRPRCLAGNPERSGLH